VTVDQPQYALPLVVRVERAAPPERTDALECAASAVLFFLSDPRTTGVPRAADQTGRTSDPRTTGYPRTADGQQTIGGPRTTGDQRTADDGLATADPRAVDGEWTAAARAWEDARIRKVVRRARGAGWQRALALPGITVTHRTAQLRVFPPVPVDDWPPDLARLQVAGTDFADTVPPAAAAAGTPVLWLNPELPMTAGKAMAQAGHAAQLAWWRLGPRERSEWKELDFKLAVRTAPAPNWAALLASGLPVVRDGGFTEVAPGSSTVVADLPRLRSIR
jgi:hypothetical protein